MIRVDGASEFKGYDHLELNGKVTALFIDGKAVDSVSAGEEAVVIMIRPVLCGVRRRWAIKAN